MSLAAEPIADLRQSGLLHAAAGSLGFARAAFRFLAAHLAERTVAAGTTLAIGGLLCHPVQACRPGSTLPQPPLGADRPRPSGRHWRVTASENMRWRWPPPVEHVLPLEAAVPHELVAKAA